MWCSPSPDSARNSAIGLSVVERLDQLDVGVAAIEIGEPHVRALDLFAGDDGEAVPPAKALERGVGVAHRDRNVVEAADLTHESPLRISIFSAATASTAAVWRSCSVEHVEALERGPSARCVSRM